MLGLSGPEWLDAGPSRPQGLADCGSPALAFFSDSICLQGQKMAAATRILISSSMDARGQTRVAFPEVHSLSLSVRDACVSISKGMHCADGLG